MNVPALKGIKVVDLTRVLAGPSATQILGDFGADVIKVERPGVGDDTRSWGPPFVSDNSSESAYYLSVNRSKRSIALDITSAEGQETLHQLIAKADILVENFKVGGLEKYGFSYEQLHQKYPKLIYASLTGFGQTGPAKDAPGYDFMIQGLGGIMSTTGPKDGEPYKVGVAISDLMAGQYLLNGILAALYARERGGSGQHIDVSLFETQLAWLANLGQYYLTSGENPPRVGNAHTTIVPYEVFETSDGHFILAVGNDTQFKSFCAIAGLNDLANHPDYATNPMRVKNREQLLPIIRDAVRTKSRAQWLDLCEKNNIPAGPINSISEAFSLPQVAARNMIIEMNHPDTDTPVKLTANPVKFSDTPVEYHHSPPKCGADTDDILRDWLGE